MKAKGLTRETIKQLGIYERNFPSFKVGDTIAVSQIIKERVKKEGGKGEEEKQRIQVFQGDVISQRGSGICRTFKVRKMGPNNVAVEKTFPYYSPLIDSIELVRRGKVRRAKLFYIRNLVGRAARITELVLTRKEKEKKAEQK
jgi:large subunit ribosomal protein L19